MGRLDPQALPSPTRIHPIADSLFEPFITSGKQGGTGLGLAVVQKVVLDHDGTIEVTKPEGGGTAFTIRLPLPST